LQDLSKQDLSKAWREKIVGIGAADIACAAEHLLNGALVGMPTETVYGLAADATQGMAVAQIYEAKGRPVFNPLISHVSDLAMAQEHGIFNADALKLAESFWPGPLTLVVPFRPGSEVSPLARAGLDTIALRVPDSETARALIRSVGRPLAAPSANRSGRISPTSAQDVLVELGSCVAVVMDGGRCAVGVESTVVACLDEEPFVLRPGGVTRTDLECHLGARIRRPLKKNTLISPGMLASHYAPLAQVRMNCLEFAEGEAILAFGETGSMHIPASTLFYNLSPTGDLRQAASEFFSALRELDSFGAATIAVMPIPLEGLGEAINDRLIRAAAPRP
jgi:L-threonylcarbamoyladenylate synthase